MEATRRLYLRGPWCATGCHRSDYQESNLRQEATLSIETLSSSVVYTQDYARVCVYTLYRSCFCLFSCRFFVQENCESFVSINSNVQIIQKSIINDRLLEILIPVNCEVYIDDKFLEIVDSENFSALNRRIHTERLIRQKVRKA